MEQDRNDQIDQLLHNDLQNRRRARPRRLHRREPTDVLTDRAFKSHYRFDKAGLALLFKYH
jgi:hypothetical protein